jgi:hypothetical protein
MIFGETYSNTIEGQDVKQFGGNEYDTALCG